MARLAEVRKRREEAERRKAEEQAEQARLASKEKAESEAKSKSSSGPQKLNPLEVRDESREPAVRLVSQWNRDVHYFLFSRVLYLFYDFSLDCLPSSFLFFHPSLLLKLSQS